jgi:hypothetical protein
VRRGDPALLFRDMTKVAEGESGDVFAAISAKTKNTVMSIL